MIYKRTRDGYAANDFTDRVNGKKNILCIIHTDSDNVFGGYTQKGFNKNGDTEDTKDLKAFLFSIRSSKNYPPRIFNPNKTRCQVRNDGGSLYCMFGVYPAFWLQDSGRGQCYGFLGFEEPENGEQDYLIMVIHLQIFVQRKLKCLNWFREECIVVWFSELFTIQRDNCFVETYICPMSLSDISSLYLN